MISERRVSSAVELSWVIPVYQGSRTIGQVVDQIHACSPRMRFEVFLVNDGSSDDSEEVCSRLVERYPETVNLLQLSRNFGEHHAVLAALNYVRGRYVAVLDDDGQNRPQDVLRMLAHAQEHNLDVVYGRYRERKHPWHRILGSWFNDKVANLVLGKPPRLYLSSFKVMNRFVVDEITRYNGPFPYLDGLILRATRNIGQIDVDHHARQAGSSGYTLSKLVGLWLNMVVGFSIVPLRASLLLGMTAAAMSLLMLVGIVVDKLWINPQVTVGIPSVLACVVFFAGVQLVILGVVGEYLGRMFLHQSGMSPYVVRYWKRRISQSANRQKTNWHGFQPGTLTPFDRAEDDQ
jgi:undecaprenyl-phosphate 4-deoxy-4-formamido-L-arabinose transferase